MTATETYGTYPGIPVWFDFGASLDPRCQNIYRFLLKHRTLKRQAGSR